VLVLRLTFDFVQGAEERQRLAGSGILVPGLVEAATSVHPTPDVSRAAVRRVVARVGIRLHEAPIPVQESRRELLRATRGEVEHGEGVCGVAQVDPRIRGATRSQQCHRTVIGVERERLLHAVDHRSIKRIEHDRALSQVIAQGRV